MPRAKRASDEVYNARRRARRLIARLEKSQAATVTENRARESYIQSLKEAVSSSYAKNRSRQALADSKRYAEKLDRMTAIPRANRTASARSEAIFRQQLAAARAGSASSVTEAEVSVFYAATRRIWKGHDVRERNELIKRALGVSSLIEAFDKVMSEPKNREAVDKYNDFSDSETPDGERQGSPKWDAYIKLF